MTCRDAERLIDTFFDGELEGRLMREAALHITRCRQCEGEIQDRERVHDLLKSAVDDEVAGIDLSSIWAAVEPVVDRGRGGRKVLSWRVAASARVGRVLRGHDDRGGADHRQGRDDPAGAHHRMEQSGWSGRRWYAPRVAGFAALAASLVLAVSLAMLGGSNPTVPQQTGNSARVADPAAPIREVAARAVAPQPAVRMARVGGGTVSGPSMIRPVAARSRRRGGQVQIESVDSRAGAMAMWSVPASDTAVIWLGDADPRARLPR